MLILKKKIADNKKKNIKISKKAELKAIASFEELIRHDIFMHTIDSYSKLYMPLTLCMLGNFV